MVFAIRLVFFLLAGEERFEAVTWWTERNPCFLWARTTKVIDFTFSLYIVDITMPSIYKYVVHISVFLLRAQTSGSNKLFILLLKKCIVTGWKFVSEDSGQEIWHKDQGKIPTVTMYHQPYVYKRRPPATLAPSLLSARAFGASSFCNSRAFVALCLRYASPPPPLLLLLLWRHCCYDVIATTAALRDRRTSAVSSLIVLDYVTH